MATIPRLRQLIQPSDVADFDYAGIDAIISDDASVLVTGSVTANHTSLTSAGAAYAYEFVNGFYTNEQKLVASDATSFDKFGHRVYLSGDGLTIFVAAHEQNSDVVDGGAVYVFRKIIGVWTQTQRIIPTVTPVTGDKFGFSLGISADGKTLAVGVHLDSTVGTNQGTVYVFEDTGSGTFTQSAKYTASDAVNSTAFGFNLYLSKDGKTLFVGAVTPTSVGAVYIIEKGAGWANGNEDSKIVASDGAASDFFGAAVNAFSVFGGTPITSSFNGELLLIGAYGWEGGAGTNVGAVYYFKKNTTSGLWEEIQIISTPTVSQNFHFLGYSVTTNQDAKTLVISGQSDDVGGTDVGRAFIYKFNGVAYIQEQDLQSDPLSVGSFFSYRVYLSADGRYLVSTSSDYNGAGTDEGATYIYDLIPGGSTVITGHTVEEHAQSLSNYLPNGHLYRAKNKTGTNFWSLLLGFAKELFRTDDYISTLEREILPDNTVLFLDDWERVVGIPDNCFDGTGTQDERRLHVLLKLASLGIQTRQDFINLAAIFGITVNVVSGTAAAAFPMTLPLVFGTPQDAKFTMVVTFSEVDSTEFPYTFPFIFGDAIVGMLKCLYLNLRPANVDIIFIQV